NNVGVLQASRGLGLALKANEYIRVRKDTADHDFEGDQPIERGFIGEIDNAHAAMAQLTDDFVADDGRQSTRDVTVFLKINARRRIFGRIEFRWCNSATNAQRRSIGCALLQQVNDA